MCPTGRGNGYRGRKVANSPTPPPYTPAGDVDCCALHDPVECRDVAFGQCCGDCRFYRTPAETAEQRLLVEAHNLGIVKSDLDALRAAACSDPTLHAVADAPLRPLSDLLRAATEFVDGDNHTPDAFDALRAAVRALQGPPAPFRPQQAH